MTFTLGGFGSACALALALVFLVSGATKLAWSSQTQAAFAGLGLPRPQQLSVAVPVAELVLATLLIAFPVLGGVAALAALAVFTATLAHLLRRGVDAPCGCLGSPHDTTPISWRTLVRNAALAALALAALFAEPGLPSGPEIALTAIVVALGWIALALLRTSGAPTRVTGTR